VTGDDFGVSVPVNEAIEEAHVRGILTAASLMVAGPAAADAVARARRLLSLRVGLHVVVTRGRPVLPASQVPDLVGADGRFRTGLFRAGLAYFFRRAARRQLRAEIQAQFEAFARTGLALDHADAHNHLQLHPTVSRAIVEAGRAHGLPALRVPAEPTLAAWRAFGGRLPARLLERALLCPWVALLSRRASRAGLVRADSVFGVHDSGRMTEERLARLIERLPAGTTEIHLHPFARTWPGMEPGMVGYRGPEELAALTSPRVAAAVEKRGARRASYSDLTEPRPEAAR
jgi:hopanoid biosynthesis associated protein HpnK